MARSTQRLFAVITLTLLFIIVSACSSELNTTGVDFACESDDDCADGFECVERPDGRSVCTQDGPFDAPDAGTDADIEPDAEPDANHQSCTCDPRLNQGYSCDDDQCHYFCLDGFESCTSQAGCETDITTVADCGDCDVTCEFEVEFPNATATCDDGGCVADCDEGWLNADGDFATGCECNISDDPTALPKCDAIFVSATDGNDGNNGLSTDSPVATLDQGVRRARSEGTAYLMVEEGTFALSETLDFHVSIIGGLDPDNQWRRDDDARTTITDGGTGDDGLATTMLIDFDQLEELDDESTLSVFANLTIEPPSTPAESGASIATVRAHDVSEGALRFENTTIVGGQASHGIHGDHGSVGDDGGNGEQGNRDHSVGDLPIDNPAGGSAGCADAGQGGDGGTVYFANYSAGTPEYNGSGLDGGSSDAGDGGDGGDGGWNDFIYENPAYTLDRQGEHGTSGQSGDAGSPGTRHNDVGAPAAGYLSTSGLWTPLASTSGQNGQSGSGGGGGGAGGSNVYYNETHLGDTGNAGGGGGCGGGGGEAGQNGGASFALILIHSQISLDDDVHIEIGIGGDGGDAGDGACGGNRGSGAQNYYTNEEGTSPGNGGFGGHGGTGGAGGGGAGGIGGPAIGIALVGDSQIEGQDYTIDDDVDPSHGGDAGSGTSDCPGADSDGGQSGLPGLVEALYSFESGDS